MAEKIVNTKNLSHDEWLKIRKDSIGGSEAGAILGLNPYSSMLRVYLDKKDLTDPVEDNEAMRLGRDLEQYVADRWMEKTGKKCRNDNFMYRSKEHPFMSANVDRVVVGENAGLECKTMSPMSKYDLEAGEIPAQYYAQAQHYMAVMGYDKMYMGILVYQKGIFCLEINRNDEFIENMIAQEETFWNDYILKNVMPSPSVADEDTIAELYPGVINREMRDLSDTGEAIAEYKRLQVLEKEIKEQMATQKNKICNAIGDYEGGTCDRYKVTWKVQSRTSIDSKRLATMYPDAYEACKKETSARVMRITERKVV